MKKHRWLFIPLLILGINFIFRLIDQSKIIKIFPLDYTNDISAYMAHLFFLNVCGFLQQCPYWYNGFVTFTTIPPGWFFFTYPIYILTKNVLLSTFLSWITIYLIAFIIIFLFGKLYNLSITKRIAFFLLFYGNAIAVGNYMRLMRVHELFALVFSTAIIFMALYYKDREFDKYILFLIPLYSIVILSHQVIAILASFVLLSLFLVKKYKEKTSLLLIIIFSFVLTSFWWIPYITTFKNTIGTGIKHSGTLWFLFKFNDPIFKTYLPQNIASIIVPIAFLIIFYVYYKQKNKDNKELLFYSPFIIISLLMITRLTAFIPFFNYVYPDSQMHFLLFLSIFMFLTIKIKYIKLISFGLIIISLISMGVNVMYTPEFRTYTQLETDTLELFPYIDDRYTMLGSSSITSYPNAYFSYGPIFYNLNTSSGWSLPNKEHDILEKNLYRTFTDKNCKGLKENLVKLETAYVITSESNCEFMNSCGLKNIKTKNKVCLYKNEM